MEIKSAFILTKPRFWLFIYLIAHLLQFSIVFVEISTTPLYNTFRSVVGYGFPIAKASAYSIALSTGLIIFPICRNINAYIRKTFLSTLIPFDILVGFHRYIGISIGVFGVPHVFAHLFNILWITMDSGESTLSVMWTYPTFLSGMMLVVVMFLMTTASMPNVKQRNYEIFFYVHHLYSVI